MEERSEYASEDRFREVRIVDVYVSNLRLVVETKHHTLFLSVCVRVVEEAVTCCFGTYVYVSVSLFVLEHFNVPNTRYTTQMLILQLKNCTIKNKSLGSNGFFLRCIKTMK